MCGEVADEWRSDPAYASAGLAEVFAGESAPVPNLFAIATFDFIGEPSALAQWLNPTLPREPPRWPNRSPCPRLLFRSGLVGPDDSFGDAAVAALHRARGVCALVACPTCHLMVGQYGSLVPKQISRSRRDMALMLLARCTTLGGAVETAALAVSMRELSRRRLQSHGINGYAHSWLRRM